MPAAAKFYLRILVIALACLGAATLIALIAGWSIQEPMTASENWPPQPAIDPAWKKIIDTAAENPRARAFNVTTYEADGDYLTYSALSEPKNGPNIELDPNGLPKPKYGNRFYYNPVTLAQFALASHGRHQTDKMITAIDHLVSMMDDEGALRYSTPFRHYVAALPLKSGWTSGMAQGQFLSAIGRAYKLTGDRKYLDAGNKALAFLQSKHPLGPMSTMEGLHPSLSEYIFFLEYPAEPNVYTLNGYMFTLLGLYDWSQLADSEEAADLFQQGVRTLEKILPYYDLEKITAYDLSFITHAAQPFQVERRPHIAARYHAVHVNQLRALYSVTGNATLNEFAEKWAGY